MVMMAESKQAKIGTSRQEPSRLQRRAPASLKINREADWNVAIPLLSPLATSPDQKDVIDFVCSNKDDVRKSKSNNNIVSGGDNDLKEAVVFKKWQHPAAPFCYEPKPLVPFVCSGGGDR